MENKKFKYTHEETEKYRKDNQLVMWTFGGIAFVLSVFSTWVILI